MQNGRIIINMPPPFSKKRGYMSVGTSVGRMVSQSVGRSVDHMLSAAYLKYYLSQSLHIHILVGHN
jgi:hypothetical protein